MVSRRVSSRVSLVGRDPQVAGFGTFGGVFTPCTLTILGVIMFLRFGEVAGNTGALTAVAVVLAAKAITTLTALSLSAVATNTRVQGGGAYYLISRSLGVEFGGAIGVVFFLAQAVSVAMYVIGFTEAFLDVFPQAGWSPRAIASAVNVLTFVCVFIGAGWTIKVQYGILAVLGLSLLSFFLGCAQRFDLGLLQANLYPAYEPGQNAFTMFALFFPAATGIMAGANMSGDLARPAESIPRGTLLAILVTGVIYLAMAVLLCAVHPREVLIHDSMAVKAAAWSGGLITAGIFAATLSSALGSMMGAPRILQALARDQVFSSLRGFAAGSGPSDEPRRATVVSFVIAQAAILLGDLDAIAPVITMFFMITYGALNLATFSESIVRNPSYRPTFRFSHWSSALLGALGCLVAMILISPLWATVSVVGMAGLHWYIGRLEIQATWGDVQSGAAFERARKNLLRLEEEHYHPKNWRPSILALSGGAWTRVHLAVYAHWLGAGRGVLTLAQVIVGAVDDHLERRASQEEGLRKFVDELGLEAFSAVLVAPRLSAGIEALVQCYGIGALRPNVILTGWSSDPARLTDFSNVLRSVSRLERSIVTIRALEARADPWVVPGGTVDVWWRGMANGPLMLLLAHLLVQNDAWRGKTLRLIRTVGAEGGRPDATAHLEALIRSARIPAVPTVVVASDFKRALATTSGGRAAVVFLGFEPPVEGREAEFVAGTSSLFEDLGTVVLVHSAGDVRLDA